MYTLRKDTLIGMENPLVINVQERVDFCLENWIRVDFCLENWIQIQK